MSPSRRSTPELALGRGWRASARGLVPRRARDAFWGLRRATRPRVTADALLAAEPVSRIYGLDRGTPLDRHYIVEFLGRHSGDVRGHVAEMADARYTTKFGGDLVERSDVLHFTPGNPLATVIGDLVSGDGIPAAAYDCMIVVNTFRLIYDVQRAVATVHRALRPGGVLLATFDGVAARCPDAPDWEGDYWRFTAAGVQRLVGDVFGSDSVAVEVFGNVRTATALLYGLAAEDLAASTLSVHDPDYPVTIGVRARKA